MQTICTEKATGTDTFDEELHDVLIAISVVARRFAKKLETSAVKEKPKEES